jgi:putative glutamine amidotransferase
VTDQTEPRSDDAGQRRPRIVVTVQAPSAASDPALAARKNALYLTAISEAGGDPLALDALSDPEARRSAFDAMDALLLSGGADVEPARYGQVSQGALSTEPERDALEWAAWLAALERRLPILGICRGLQVINVFAGGRLVQHLDGHEGEGYGRGPARLHTLSLDGASRLAAIMGHRAGATLTVNSYHHQGVRLADLAPGLRAVGSSPGDGADEALVEALESSDLEHFLMAVQCHPERTESTPPEFAHLFRAFVEAARSS